MSKKTILIAVLFIAMASWIAYTEGTKFYQAQKTKWITTGALQMREAVFEAVSKGEVQIRNGKGDQQIIIKK